MRNSYLCPFCEGNGEIHRAKIKGTEKIIYICGECDTVFKDLNLDPDECEGYYELMERLGRPDTWSELEDIVILEKDK